MDLLRRTPRRAGIVACANGEERPANVLPLTLSVTKTPFERPPDYFGGGAGNPYTWVDFPVCPVEIDGEYWVIYKNGDIPTVFRWRGTNLENGKRQADGSAPLPVRRPYLLGGLWYDPRRRSSTPPCTAVLRRLRADGAADPPGHQHR